jgi:hypothetical protein
VQSEFSEEREMLFDYLISDALLGRLNYPQQQYFLTKKGVDLKNER